MYIIRFSIVFLVHLLMGITLQASVKYAVTSGNWNGSVWATSAMGAPGTASTPTAADAVIISNNVTLSITANAMAYSVMVGQPGTGSALLNFNNVGNVSLSVTTDLTVNKGDVFVSNSAGNISHSLVVGGSLMVATGCTLNMVSNDGSDVCDVTFTKNGNAVIAGAGSIRLNRLNLIMGVNTANILDVTGLISMTDGGLTLFGGTFKLSSASVIVPFTSVANIPVNARLWNNGGTINSSMAVDWALAGILQVSAGTINQGIAADDRIVPSSTGTGLISISGGSLNCAGRIENGSVPWTFQMTGGTLTVGVAGNTQTGCDPFKMDNACSFSMSGGTLVIRQSGGSPGQNLGYHNLAMLGLGFTGGTLQMGDAGTPVGNFMNIETPMTIYNLSIASPNVVALLSMYPAKVSHDVCIVAGTLNLNSFNLNIGHDLKNDGSFNPSTGTVTFDGTSSQSIGGMHATSFMNLTIHNTTPMLSASTIVLNNNVSVSGLLSLTRGFLVTSTFHMLSLLSSASAVGSNPSSYVNGPMRKTGTTAFDFPIGYGNGIKWGRIGIGATTTNTTFTAQYFALPFFNITSKSVWTTPLLHNVSSKEFWQLDRTAGSGAVSISLFWEDAAWSGINDCTNADLRVVRWTGASWEIDINAVLTSGSCTGSVAGMVKTTTPMNTFGTLTFGSLSDGLNPLPVELVHFDARLEKKEVILNWTTASEYNNDFFEVERSTNTENFEKVAVIKGAGTSNETTFYADIDRNPYAGTSYYRLKQVDFDGKYSFSNTIAIYRNNTSAFNPSVYPNPVGDRLFMDFSVEDISDFKVEMTDALGNKVLEQNYPGYVQRTLSWSTANLAAGIYSLKISGMKENNTLCQKIIMVKK